MEILNSKIMNIEGRQYINYNNIPSQDDYYNQEEIPQRPSPSYESDHTARSLLKETVSCPNALFRHVIGFRGQTIKRLQEETGARIDVPRGKNSSGLTISANSNESLEAAATRIQLLLSEKRWKEPFKHLITIPLMEQSVKDGFEEFKHQVLTKCGDDNGVNERLFQDVNKLHLTIGTLVLLDDSECDRAVEIMQKIQRSKLFREDMLVQVNGIEYMNDDPEMIDVLYAKVECPAKPGFLQQLADYIVSEYVDAGFMKREHEHVKLHATVMNSIRTVDNKAPHEKGHKKGSRETFNGRNILSLLQYHNFGNFPLKEIHISRRYTADKSGYYESLYVANMQ